MHRPENIAPRPARGPRGLAAAVLLALAACEPVVEGNGVLGEEPREVPAFVGVAVADGIQATLTAGVASSVRLRGDENLLRYVETAVVDRAGRGAVLEVRASSTYQSKIPLEVSIGAPVISFVSSTDASPTSLSGAAAPVLAVEASDGSRLTISGAGGDRLELALAGGQHGGATLDARGYPVAQAQVALSGGSTARLDATAAVGGTATGGSTLENEGPGACAVTASEGSVVTCAAR